MTVKERQEHLIKEISSIKNEQVLEMLEESLTYFRDKSVDITDGMSVTELSELESLVSEPSDKDVVTEDEYKKATDRWRTKS